LKIKISIVIPVYNVEKYIRECVQSCITQTLKEIEILLIDDCTPDNSIQGIADIIRKYKNIRVIHHKENKGHGGALNTGKREAKGEYIWFVDSDDFLDINACEFLYNYAKDKELDALGISANNYTIVNSVRILIKENKYLYGRFVYGIVLNGKDFFYETYIKYLRMNTPQWAYLFKKTALESYNFRENVSFEDNDGTPIILYNLKRIAAIKYAPYYRLIHDRNSINYMNTIDPHNRLRICSQRLAIIESLITYIEKKSLKRSDPFVYFTLRSFNTEISKQYKQLTHGLSKGRLQLRYKTILRKIKKIAGIKNDFLYRLYHGFNPPIIYWEQFWSEPDICHKIKYLIGIMTGR
jgi:glycosyltransferase involved in cell wall biosynthesis